MTSSTASSCVVYGTEIDTGRVPVVGVFDGYPINLHFSVTSSKGDSVELSFNDFEGKDLYKLCKFHFLYTFVRKFCRHFRGQIVGTSMCVHAAHCSQIGL